jgi:hypothetical protein
VKKSKPDNKKKTAPKGSAKAPAKKAAAKPVKKAPAKAAKPAPKKAAKAPVKKAAAKPVAKKPAKAPAKPVKKPVAKAAVKAAAKPVKKEAPKSAKAAVKEVVKAKAAPAPVKKEEAKSKAAPALKPAAPVKETKEAPTPKVKGAKAEKAPKIVAPVETFPALDPSIKRPAKPFFLEVKPGVERVIKRGDKSAATTGLDIQARRKGPAAEESPEELAERIERELQSQSFLKRNRMRPQLCTKCGINAVSPRFTIDRELGYCDSCAEILRLGETKEARRMEFNLALKKEEGEDVVEPEEGPAPDEVEDVPDVED